MQQSFIFTKNKEKKYQSLCGVTQKPAKQPNKTNPVCLAK